MCDYFNNGCTIQNQYDGTDMCINRHASCSGNAYISIKGFEEMPQNAIDWSVFLRGETQKYI